MKEYKVQKSKLGQFTLTMPKTLVEMKGWHHGTKIIFRFGSKGEVVLEERKE